MDHRRIKTVLRRGGVAAKPRCAVARCRASVEGAPTQQCPFALMPCVGRICTSDSPQHSNSAPATQACYLPSLTLSAFCSGTLSSGAFQPNVGSEGAQATEVPCNHLLALRPVPPTRSLDMVIEDRDCGLGSRQALQPVILLGVSLSTQHTIRLPLLSHEDMSSMILCRQQSFFCIEDIFKDVRPPPCPSGNTGILELPARLEPLLLPPNCALFVFQHCH